MVKVSQKFRMNTEYVFHSTDEALCILYGHSSHSKLVYTIRETFCPVWCRPTLNDRAQMDGVVDGWCSELNKKPRTETFRNLHSQEWPCLVIGFSNSDMCLWIAVQTNHFSLSQSQNLFISYGGEPYLSLQTWACTSRTWSESVACTTSTRVLASAFSGTVAWYSVDVKFGAWTLASSIRIRTCACVGSW